jgi:hypothetical protein
MIPAFHSNKQQWARPLRYLYNMWQFAGPQTAKQVIYIHKIPAAVEYEGLKKWQFLKF